MTMDRLFLLTLYEARMITTYLKIRHYKIVLALPLQALSFSPIDT